MFIDGLHFQPWIGSNYRIGSGTLALGESHYLDEEPTEEDDFSAGYGDLTIQVVRDGFLARASNFRTPFFKNTGLLFDPNDSYKIWSELAFANLIQIGLAHAKSQPTEREKQTIGPAFRLLLDHLQPTRVIVLSKRMWNHWIPETTGRFVSHISVNGKYSTIWEYPRSGGKCLAMGVAHPSMMLGKSRTAWKSLIDEFLLLDGESS